MRLYYFFAFIWFVNGLFCKILDLVPRHREIVGRILGEQYAGAITITIGFLELLMVVWILSRIKPKWCAICQIGLIISMNILEYFLASDLLLHGQLNILFAFIFAALIYYSEFKVGRQANVR